jgi:hypothetical protein
MQFENPVNMAIDSDGTKYLCDAGRRSILVFDALDRFVREIGDPPNCTPLDVVIHGDELFVADVVGGEVEVWTKQGKLVRTISSKGMTADQLGEPTNLDIAGGLLFVTDTRQLSVKVFTLDGQFQNLIGQAGSTWGNFGRPKGIAVAPDMHVYVADALFDAIQIFQADGQLLYKFGAPGDMPESVVMPAGIAVDTTSIPMFAQYLDPKFEAQYLLLIVNQFGFNKVAVWAYGKDKTLPPEAYIVKPATQPATQPATGPTTGPMSQ